MNNEITDPKELLKVIRQEFENGNPEEVLQVLISLQHQHLLTFTVDELGLMLLTKKTCIALADVYLKSELPGQAKTIYEFVLKYFPEDSDTTEKLVSSQLAFSEELIHQFMYDDARSLLNEIIGIKSKHIHAMIDLGVLDVLEKKYDSAKTMFQNVLEVEPENEVALENIQYIIQEAAST